MKVELNDISPVRKSLSVEVDADEVARQTEKVLKDYRRKAKIPGFRPGKAPLSVVRSHFGKEAQEDVRDRIISASFVEAAKEKGLEPLGEPALEDVSFEEGRPLTFKTVFEVLPSIDLKNYREVEVTQPTASVADDEVRAALEEIRRSRTQLVAEEGREAVEGDVVYVDVEGTVAEGESIHRERMPIEIGAEANLEEFNKHLAGARAGAEIEFTVDYPDGYGAKDLAGKRVDYRLSVQEVKRPVLPDLDDELAKDLGDFENLAALEAKVRTDLEERKKHEAEMAARQAVLDKVLIENPVVLPEVLVAHEIRHRLEDFVRNLIMQGIDPEKTEIDWEELKKKQEEPARKSVHARLILDAVAQAQKIEVESKEVEDRIVQDAARIGETPEKLRAQLQKHSGKEALMTQLVREKSLDYLTSVANIHYAD
jgi:trigger factor